MRVAAGCPAGYAGRKIVQKRVETTMRFPVLLASLIAGLLPGIASASATAGIPATIATPAAASSIVGTDFNLPKLGLAGGAALPLWKAQVIGRQIYYQIQQADGVLNDPLVDAYVDYLGHRLSSVANGPDEPFHYFPVREDAINAFALPGAFIGVNTGLIRVTRNEDELAGVLAHETAHVVQRHIARQVADAKYNTLINLGILLGAIAVAAANPDMAAGALMGAEGGVAQRQINYTRADEMEADRVGIAILAKARFKPQGMVDFFKYMERNYALQGYHMPEFLSTHPLDLTRISEAENRAKQLHVNPRPEDRNYALMRARIRVLDSDDPAKTLAYFRDKAKSDSKPWYREAAVYGMVLCLNRLDEAARALALIKPLAERHSDNVALQLAVAESLLAAGKTQAGLAALDQDDTLYPSNRAVSADYARALVNAGHPAQAVKVLSPLLTDYEDVLDPDLFKLLATAANRSGDAPLAELAMADYFGLRGQYRSARIQLRRALAEPHLSAVRRTQIEDRKKALEAEYKQAKKLGLIQPDQPGS